MLVESVLEAARLILQREGPAALTTNRIARVAGVSVGSLYRYFEDKEAVVDALFRADEEQALARRVEWARHAMDLPLEPMFRFFVTRIVAEHRMRRALHAAVHERHARHSDVRRLADEQIPPHPSGRHVVEAFLIAWCKRHRSEIRPVAIGQAAFLLDRVGYEMMRATVNERPALLDDESYVEEMVQLLTRYLRRDPA